MPYKIKNSKTDSIPFLPYLRKVPEILIPDEMLHVPEYENDSTTARK